MPILMAVVGVWLEHTWLRPDRRKRILLVEELPRNAMGKVVKRELVARFVVKETVN